jgi:hypothetical protein
MVLKYLTLLSLSEKKIHASLVCYGVSYTCTRVPLDANHWETMQVRCRCTEASVLTGQFNRWNIVPSCSKIL